MRPTPSVLAADRDHRHRATAPATALLVVLAVTTGALAACSSDPAATPATTAPTTATTTTTAPTTTEAMHPQPGASGVGDPYFPDLGNGGYDVVHYGLDLRWHPDTGTLDGTATIDLVPGVDLSSFNLDLVGLDASSVTVGGTAATTAHDGRELTVTPAEPLPSGDPTTVVVTYAGQPAPIHEGTDYYDVGWHTDGRDAFVVSEPAGAATWFPANDHPTDKATYDLTVTVPEDLSVIATGTLQQRTTGPGTATFHYATGEPTASYLVSVVIGDLVFDEGTAGDGTPLRSAYPSRLARAARTDFAAVPDMFPVFTDWFGPYPFDVYGQVVVDEPLGFALENQTLSLFGSDVVVGGGDVDVVAAHELSHQWFGDAVSPATWKDIWLNEGFATFAEWIWIQESGGRRISRSAELTYGRLGGGGVAPGDPGADELFAPPVYLRGGLTLYAVYHELGEARFKELLRTWVARHRDGVASTQDFRSLVAEVAGRPLDDLLDAWLYGEELPPLP